MAWNRPSRTGIPACRTGAGFRVIFDSAAKRKPRSTGAQPGAITRLSPAKYRPLERSPVHRRRAGAVARRRARSRRSGRSPARPSLNGRPAACRADGRARARPGQEAAARWCATAPAGARKLPASNGANACGAIRPGQRRGIRGRAGRALSEIDAEADHDPVAAALEQDAGQLPAEQQHVVRPFEHQRLAGDGNVDRFDQGEPGGERERLRRRVAGREARPACCRRNCRRATTHSRPCRPLPACCFERDQPVAFARRSVGNRGRRWSSRSARRCGCGSEERSRGAVGERAQRTDQEIADAATPISAASRIKRALHRLRARAHRRAPARPCTSP